MNNQHNHAPAAQIEKHILENACTSNWLRSTFQLAIRRDPVDALNDAELLANALRARSLEALSEATAFNPQITSTLLKQHAESLSMLAKSCPTPYSLATSRLKHNISSLVVHIHEVARELHTSVEISDPNHHEFFPQNITAR